MKILYFSSDREMYFMRVLIITDEYGHTCQLSVHVCAPVVISPNTQDMTRERAEHDKRSCPVRARPKKRAERGAPSAAARVPSCLESLAALTHPSYGIVPAIESTARLNTSVRERRLSKKVVWREASRALVDRPHTVRM